MKYTLAIIVVLVLASSAHAQNTPLRASSNTPNYSGGGWGGGLGSGGFSSGSNTVAGHPVVYEEPRELPLVYATNDGPFVPSTFMKYEDALALGKQQLAQQKSDAGASLADAARAYRFAKVPTFRLRTRVLQDNGGNLQICNLNGNDCRRL